MRCQEEYGNAELPSETHYYMDVNRTGLESMAVLHQSTLNSCAKHIATIWKNEEKKENFIHAYGCNMKYVLARCPCSITAHNSYKMNLATSLWRQHSSRDSGQESLQLQHRCYTIVLLDHKKRRKKKVWFNFCLKVQNIKTCKYVKQKRSNKLLVFHLIPIHNQWLDQMLLRGSTLDSAKTGETFWLRPTTQMFYSSTEVPVSLQTNIFLCVHTARHSGFSSTQCSHCSAYSQQLSTLK